MEKRKRKRIELIDLAKAITIFLVILGHSTDNYDTSMFRRVLYSFHMPLFFLLAGMSIKPVLIEGFQGWKKFLKKNILALIVPFLLWGLIYAPFSCREIPKLLYASWKSLTAFGTLTSLWYLAAFFVARVLSQITVSSIMKVGQEKVRLYCGLSSVPFLAVGLLLPYLEGGYPWCFDVALVATGFVLLGISLRNPLLILAQQKGWVLLAVLAISTVLFCFGTVMLGDDFPLMLMCGAQYGNKLLFLFDSFAGSMMILSLTMILARIAREGIHPFSLGMITFIGQYTMGIFLVHKNLLQQLIVPFVGSLMPPSLLLYIISALITLVISMGICVVIRAYVPQILGQFPRYEERPAVKA